MKERVSVVALGQWAVMLIAAVVAGGCSKPVVKDPRLLPPTVLVSRTEEANSSSRAFTGIVKARVQSELGFRVGGKILERCVDAGQRVKKGQPLMRLDPIDLKLSAAAEKANVEAARARYIQAKADEARFVKLLKSDVISAQDYDRIRAALDSAKADLDAMEAQSRISDNSSEYAVLPADADGVIVQTLSEPGQVVTAGQIVIELAHDGPREAAVNLPENVRPSMGATATARLYGLDQKYQAKLRQLSDAADPATRTFESRYVLEGDAASAPLGSTVTVSVPVKQDTSDHLIIVPVGAVYDPGSGPGVWIVGDKQEVSFRSVKILSVGKEEVVVSKGLEAGESVVALGAHLLHEGQIINRINEVKTPDGKL
jgi:RND family efflux transporter MFP subunit